MLNREQGGILYQSPFKLFFYLLKTQNSLAWTNTEGRGTSSYVSPQEIQIRIEKGTQNPAYISAECFLLQESKKKNQRNISESAIRDLRT